MSKFSNLSLLKNVTLTQLVIGGPDPGGFAKEHMAQFFDVSNTQIEFQNAQFTTSDIHY